MRLGMTLKLKHAPGKFTIVNEVPPTAPVIGGLPPPYFILYGPYNGSGPRGLWYQGEEISIYRYTEDELTKDFIAYEFWNQANPQ